MLDVMVETTLASLAIAVLVWLLALGACQSASVQYRCNGDKICMCY
jgi:hypothetical protein